MTKLQKQKHITAIKELIIANGFEYSRNRYRKGDIKIEVADNNLKVWRGDHKIFSKPMTGLTLDELLLLFERWNTQ